MPIIKPRPGVFPETITAESMKRLRTTTDYANAVAIVKECYTKNGGTPLPGSIRTYCRQTGRDDQASIVTVVHATLLKLGLMVRENGRYRFIDDPMNHTDAIISRALADKHTAQKKIRSHAGQRAARRNRHQGIRTYQTRYADPARYGLQPGRKRLV